MKTQVVVDKKHGTIICTAFSEGRKHDFNIYKKSGVHAKSSAKITTDTAFIGIKKFHANSELPHKSSKNHKLTKEQKKENHRISSERVVNEHAIGFVKRFKIVSDRYRNRRKRFGLRFNLIAGICNFELLS